VPKQQQKPADTEKANRKISRPEAGEAKRRFPSTTLPEGMALAVEGEGGAESETEQALRRATDLDGSKPRRDAAQGPETERS
jgi:hypothetical protein